MIYLNSGINSDSKKSTIIPEQPWLSKYKVDKEKVHPILSECRVFKSEDELKVMKYACQAAAEGHVQVMKHCKPGLMESYLASVMRAQGSADYNVKLKPYGDILASGKNSATLHYVDNNMIIKENQFVLCDCGHMVKRGRMK